MNILVFVILICNSLSKRLSCDCIAHILKILVQIKEETRIPEIKDYIPDNRDSYVFSALAASIDGDYEFAPSATVAELGILEVSMDARFMIVDGQHRKASIIEALAEDETLKNETISVVLYEDKGLEHSQQMFTDLNKHAVKTSNSIAELYDSRDPLAVITRRVVASIDFLNQFTDKEKIVILLGVRKAESAARSKSITAHEIEGKLLSPHVSIPKAYVYNPLTEVTNSIVWEYLLKGDGMSAWDTDNKYLFSLYQGENLGEEQSVVGEIDKDKIPITGNSRFGCWCCTMVKEDKSLQNFIDHGAENLRPLRRFRNWLVDLRATPEARDWRRRNGSVYFNNEGELGRGPFTLEARKEILRRLLMLEEETGFELITIDELKMIDKVWEDEGDLTRRALVDIYYEVKHTRLPWDQFKHANYESEPERITLYHRYALCTN